MRRSRDFRSHRRLWVGVAAAVTVLAGAASAQAASVYVTNFGGDSVSQFTVDGGGRLVPKSPATVAARNGPKGVAVSPNSRSAYVVNGFDDSVSQYNIFAGGGLSPMTPPKVAGAAVQYDYPQYAAVSPDGRSVYVTTFGFAQGVSGLRGTVLQYDAGPNGQLSRKTPDLVMGRNGTYAIAVSPDGESVYATNSISANVSQWDVGPRGRLSAKAPSAAPAGSRPIALALSPDGRNAYVVNNISNTVSQYNVAPDGRLVPKTPATVATGHYPDGVAVSPDGRSVYVPNSYSGEGVNGTVSQYNVGAGGKLAPKSPATLAAGKGPNGLAMSSDGRNVYVANTDESTISQYTVGAGGQLFPKSPAKVATGPAPIGVALTPTVPGWEGRVTNPASGCSVRVQVPYLDGSQRVTAYTEVFCPKPTQLTIRSRLRSDYTNADVTVAQQGCTGGAGCVIDEPQGFRYFKLTCPKSASRQQGQGYYSEIVIYPGTNAGAATRERSRTNFLSPFCAR